MISHRTMGRINALEKAVGIRSEEFHKFSDPGRIEALERAVSELKEQVAALSRKPGRPRKEAA